MDKLESLIHLNQKLGSMVNFDYGDDDQKKRGLVNKSLETAGATGVVGGGLYGRGVIANIGSNKSAFTMPGSALTSGVAKSDVIGNVKSGIGAFGKDAGRGMGALKNLLSKIIPR